MAARPQNLCGYFKRHRPVIRYALNRRLVIATAVMTAIISPCAQAGCGIDHGSVRILSNQIDSLRLVAQAATDCASATVTVTSNHTNRHANLQIPALTANPAEYTVAMVSNNSMTSLLNLGLIRPLNELVARHGGHLKRNQLVTVGGKVMAIAFTVDSQQFVYRADILKQAGVEPPRTYEEVLLAAKAIRERGLMRYPLAGTYLPDWDLAQEFINLYQGYGGELFRDGTPVAAIDNQIGIKALQMMNALSEFMRPEFLTYNTEIVAPMYEAGEVAMVNIWGSRAGWFMRRDDGTVPAIAAVTRFGPTPTVGGRVIPATTGWWNGFTIAQNISDADADASFVAMMHALSPEFARAHADAAVWLIDGYEPTPEAAGVLANMRAGIKPYPMTPYMGYLHTAIGLTIGDYFLKRKTAHRVLADAVATYSTSARASGYLP